MSESFTPRKMTCLTTHPRKKIASPLFANRGRPSGKKENSAAEFSVNTQSAELLQLALTSAIGFDAIRA